MERQWKGVHCIPWLCDYFSSTLNSFSISSARSSPNSLIMASQIGELRIFFWYFSVASRNCWADGAVPGDKTCNPSSPIRDIDGSPSTCRQQFLYFLPLPQGQGSFLRGLVSMTFRRITMVIWFIYNTFGPQSRGITRFIRRTSCLLCHNVTLQYRVVKRQCPNVSLQKLNVTLQFHDVTLQCLNVKLQYHDVTLRCHIVNSQRRDVNQFCHRVHRGPVAA